MVNGQIGSGFRKAWFLGSKGSVCKAVYYPIYRCPRVSLSEVSTGNFLLRLLPKPWGAWGVPAGGSARHGQLSHCWSATWVSPNTCTGQHRACSGDSWVLMEEPTPPGCTDTWRSEEEKNQSKPGGWGWRLLVPFGCYRCVSCCALRQGACTGEKVVLFSHMWIDSATFPLLFSDQLLPTASGCPPISSSPCQWSDTLLLAKSRVATCQEQKIERGGQPSERERNSKTRSAIINRQFKPL